MISRRRRNLVISTPIYISGLQDGDRDWYRDLDPTIWERSVSGSDPKINKKLLKSVPYLTYQEGSNTGRDI
jgi:hypothetical protein